MRAGKWEKTSGAEFSRTGRAFSYHADFGLNYAPPGGPPPGAPTLVRMAVMTHPKRLPMAQALAAQLQEHRPVLVCDESPGHILENSKRVMRSLIEQTTETLQEHPGARVFGVVVEDDVVLADGLSGKLLPLLATLPHGAAAFSLHAHTDPPGPKFHGWAKRLKTQIVRTQFAGWRAEFLPELLQRLENYRNEGKHRDGWDTACSWALDELNLIGCIHYPSLVQHDTQKRPSLLGHVISPSPSFVASVPDYVGGP